MSSGDGGKKKKGAGPGVGLPSAGRSLLGIAVGGLLSSPTDAAESSVPGHSNNSMPPDDPSNPMNAPSRYTPSSMAEAPAASPAFMPSVVNPDSDTFNSTKAPAFLVKHNGTLEINQIKLELGSGCNCTLSLTGYPFVLTMDDCELCEVGTEVTHAGKPIRTDPPTPKTTHHTIFSHRTRGPVSAAPTPDPTKRKPIKPPSAPARRTPHPTHHRPTTPAPTCPPDPYIEKNPDPNAEIKFTAKDPRTREELFQIDKDGKIRAPNGVAFPVVVRNSNKALKPDEAALPSCNGTVVLAGNGQNAVEHAKVDFSHCEHCEEIKAHHHGVGVDVPAASPPTKHYHHGEPPTSLQKNPPTRPHHGEPPTTRRHEPAPPTRPRSHSEAPTTPAPTDPTRKPTREPRRTDAPQPPSHHPSRVRDPATPKPTCWCGDDEDHVGPHNKPEKGGSSLRGGGP